MTKKTSKEIKKQIRKIYKQCFFCGEQGPIGKFVSPDKVWGRPREVCTKDLCLLALEIYEKEDSLDRLI